MRLKHTVFRPSPLHARDGGQATSTPSGPGPTAGAPTQRACDMSSRGENVTTRQRPIPRPEVIGCLPEKGTHRLPTATRHRPRPASTPTQRASPGTITPDHGRSGLLERQPHNVRVQAQGHHTLSARNLFGDQDRLSAAPGQRPYELGAGRGTREASPSSMPELPHATVAAARTPAVAGPRRPTPSGSSPRVARFRPGRRRRPRPGD